MFSRLAWNVQGTHRSTGGTLGHGLWTCRAGFSLSEHAAPQQETASAKTSALEVCVNSGLKQLVENALTVTPAVKRAKQRQCGRFPSDWPTAPLVAAGCA